MNTAKYVGLGPLNKNAKLDPERRARCSMGRSRSPADHPDWEIVNANRPAWTERWNKEIERR